jgi:signal transduction histidine kinase
MTARCTSPSNQRSSSASCVLSQIRVSKSQAEQIFKAFFTTKDNGTGMGLPISRSIIESHGGRLWAGDNSPRGARFCFTLPTKAETRDSVVSGDRTGPADGLHANNPVV